MKRFRLVVSFLGVISVGCGDDVFRFELPESADGPTLPLRISEVKIELPESTTQFVEVLATEDTTLDDTELCHARQCIELSGPLLEGDRVVVDTGTFDLSLFLGVVSVIGTNDDIVHAYASWGLPRVLADPTLQFRAFPNGTIGAPIWPFGDRSFVFETQRGCAEPSPGAPPSSDDRERGFSCEGYLLLFSASE